MKLCLRSLVLLIFGWLLCVGSTLAQDSLRPFDKQALRERQAREAYRYGPEPRPEAQEDNISLDGSTLQGWKWAMYLLVIGLLMALVLLILRRTLAGRGTPIGSQAEQAVDTLEDLRSLDVQTALKTAEAEQNYRLALRLRFLHVLQGLARQGRIGWQPHKTNHDYLDELPPAQRQAFAALMRPYEYVWYGEFPLSAEQYQRLARQCEAFPGLR